jgi:hypothetical protein
MTRSSFFSFVYMLVCASACTPFGIATGYAQTESVIHSFQATSAFDGIVPGGGLVADSKGALYGVTVDGGKYRAGTVYKLSPPALSGGEWKQTVLYSFTGKSDGGNPSGTVVLRASGKIFGTAQTGGSQNLGVVFELTPPSAPGTPWTESVIHSFLGSSQDGGQPENGLVSDAQGRLFGTTYSGGRFQSGTAFRLSAGPTGAWTENVIYNFGADTDGGRPDPSGVVVGAAGVLYGSTQFGGNGQGTVFGLNPPSGGGVYTQSVLYAFSGIGGDGVQPSGSPVFDSTGAIYVATLQGGQYGAGSIIQFLPPSIKGGGWTENILYSIASGGSDGYFPIAGLALDNDGAINGVTEFGGDAICNCGTSFKLSPPASAGGAWSFSVLHVFRGGDDGASPIGRPVLSGTTLYGSTLQGGTGNCSRFQMNGCGTLFQITP